MTCKGIAAAVMRSDLNISRDAPQSNSTCTPKQGARRRALWLAAAANVGAAIFMGGLSSPRSRLVLATSFRL